MSADPEAEDGEESPAAAAARMISGERQWPVIVTLKHAIELGSEHIAELKFRRGKLGDLKGMTLDGVPPVDKLLQLAARMCGQPIKVLEMLEDEDGAEVMALALSFFARCLGAGKVGKKR